MCIISNINVGVKDKDEQLNKLYLKKFYSLKKSHQPFTKSLYNDLRKRGVCTFFLKKRKEKENADIFILAMELHEMSKSALDIILAHDQNKPLNR